MRPALAAPRGRLGRIGAVLRARAEPIGYAAFTLLVFLVALVAAASLMPLKGLPDPSWRTALGLGLLSSVFDNIPLTALALRQGGYDWALLSFAVGFGGSTVWFGSSAGVAITNLYPEGRSVVRWLKESWFVPLAYVVGFFFMLLVLGWKPTAERGSSWVAPASAHP